MRRLSPFRTSSIYWSSLHFPDLGLPGTLATALMHYYIEYGGGLGDVLVQMHAGGSYHLLDHLSPGDRATVVLITHNPHARELFDYHPRADQFEVRDLGYTSPKDIPAM